MAARSDILEKLKKDREDAERRVQQSQSVTGGTPKTVSDYQIQRSRLTGGQTKAANTNWYKGDTPTETETLAQIYRVAQKDQHAAEKAMSIYQQAKAAGAWYNPYSQPTTSKMTQTSLANTQKAQAEWARLSDELSYWATRSDRNYSDDEIIARIDWDNYKTLQKMDEGRLSGSPLALTEAVGYSEDAMYGVLWAARNPGQSTGDAFMDAVQGVLGRGAAYERNEQIASRLDPTNAAYNPYAVSGTMDDLSFKYHTDKFDEQWLAENRDLLREADTAADYTKIYNAVQNTKVLQEEADAFRSALAEYAERGVQPDYDDLFEEGHRGVKFDNLKKLVESLKSGKLIDTTDAIDFDLNALIAETDAAVKLKQNQTKAATDLEAATELAEEEKNSWWQKKWEGVVAWWQNLTTPEEAVAPPTPIIEEKPSQIVSEGAEMFEPVVAQHAAEGDYNAAANEAMQEYAALLEKNPELLTTDGMQKGALFLLVAANEAGWLNDPAAQEKADSVMATVEASMGIEPEAAETKTVWSVLYNLLTGGDLSEAQTNEGIGANATLMLLWDRAMARGADLVDNVVGAAISGLGEVFNNEWLINYGKETMEHGDKAVAHYDQYTAEHGTPLENLVAKQGSELVHMAQLGSLSKIASAYKVVKAGRGAGFLTKVLMASPFALEAGGSEFQETYAETDNYTMGLAAGAAATAITSLLSQWDGILKNIEANGMPYLPAVVEALGSVPGSGVKAGLARWGKGFGMWMLNGLKTLANEGAQEAVEGGATDIIVGLIKGEGLRETDWSAFSKDRLADAVGAVFLSLGSATSTMPAYARSVKVAESQMLKSDLTAKDVATFVSALKADMQDHEIARDMQERALNVAVETRTGELIAEGAMDGLDTSAVEATQTKLAESETALTEANTAFNANPADDSAKNEVLRLIKERDAARAEAEKSQADCDAAAAELMNTVREQARAEVTQNMAAVQEARMQQEAAAEVQRQNDNVLAMQADSFVNEYMPDAPDDVKNQVRQRYMAYDGEPQNATKGMVAFASQISKKFNLNITFTDSHGIFEGAYKGGNDIVLDKNATQGEVIRRVLVHEITHAAENSKAYDDLADAVLNSYYKGNADQLNADLANIAQQYAEQAGQDGHRVARSELVAQRLSEMLSGNQDAMNRLVEEKPGVATRIWRVIKDFIGKLRGVRDPELDKLMKLEKQLEKALRTRGESNGIKFQLVDKNGNSVVLTNADIWENMNYVANMSDVVSLEGNPHKKNPDKDFLTMAQEYFDEIGRNAVSPVFGDVHLANSGLRHLTHIGVTSRRSALLRAVKPVIENGRIVHIENDHDGNGFDTAMVAAPVSVDGTPYYMGVIIKQGNGGDNSYYMHDAVFVEKNNGSAPTQLGKDGDAVALFGANPSMASILGNLANFKSEFAETENSNTGDIRFSLPSNDILDQRIAQHRNSQLAPEPNDMIPGGGEQEQNYGNGERQFVVQTLPNNPNIPDWAVEGMLNNPKARYYTTQTNREQMYRGWKRIQQNGVQAEVERLLALDTFTADDVAESNLLMAQALREDSSDPATFFALAEKSALVSTDTAQALQARTMISKMTPDGLQIWAAGQFERGLREHMDTHKPQKQQVDEEASHVADQVRDLQGGDEILSLNAGGDFTIDASNTRWGIPINEQQQALIDHYKLNNVGRPGIFYNRATLKQRMLEAIIATPNPLEVTGLGLNLIQRLEFMKRGEAVSTNADLRYMGEQLGQFVALGGEAGGRAADLALARAYEAFSNITPATRMEKFRTQRYVNMLSTFTSFARNIIGNVGQNVANATAHGIGVEIDRLASLGTGRRTMAHLSTAERIEGWRAFAEETKNTFLDFFVDKANTAPNRDKYSTNQRGRVFQNGALEMSKDIESFLMSVGDRNIWKKAFVNSMAEQQKLADRNQLFNDDGTTRSHEQMVEHAEAAANYATFTEDSLVQDVMQFIRQRSPAAADVLGLYMPFTGVPHNIMKRNFQYSPIGFLTMAGRMAANRINGRNFDQNAFVNDLSRALTGTGGVLMGVVLGLAGAIKMGTEDEQKDKVYDVETALGEQYTPYVYDPTTDTYVSMSTFAPAASPLVWGAAIGQQLKNDEFNANVLLSALSSSVDSIFDASYLSGLSDLFGGYGSFTENLAHVTAENLASQLTPAFLNQVANAMDPYVRDTKDKDYLTELMKTTLNRTPILRNKLLPEKVTVAGENVMTKQGWSLVDPFTRTNPSDNAALIEVKRLYDVIGDTAVLPSDALRSRKNELTLNKKSVTLNDQQKAEYKKYYGDLWTSEVSALMATPAYQLMDDEERAEKVEKIMTVSLKQAKQEFIDRYGE